MEDGTPPLAGNAASPVLPRHSPPAGRRDWPAMYPGLITPPPRVAGTAGTPLWSPSPSPLHVLAQPSPTPSLLGAALSPEVAEGMGSGSSGLLRAMQGSSTSSLLAAALSSDRGPADLGILPAVEEGEEPANSSSESDCSAGITPGAALANFHECLSGNVPRSEPEAAKAALASFHESLHFSREHSVGFVLRRGDAEKGSSAGVGASQARARSGTRGPDAPKAPAKCEPEPRAAGLLKHSEQEAPHRAPRRAA